jgi:NAD(P)-dependent dehydrogenase (short-subunit alcohol dehydrogenase family)
VARRIADEAGGSVVTVQGDLWTAEGMAELECVMFERFNRVDVPVNGLGEHVASAGPHEDSAEERWQALYEVNVNESVPQPYNDDRALTMVH